MTNQVVRRHEMFLRVREFGAARTALFTPETLTGELFARLGAEISELETHTQAQSSGRSAAHESASSKAAARDELRRDLEAISRTARAMALSTPGLEEKFRAPRSISDQALLALARAFAADALPLKTEFTRRGMPADFLEDLASDIEDFERAHSQKIRRREAVVAANAAIDGVLERSVNIVRELDAIMRNQFANDPISLAAWLSASHTERAPRRAASSASDTTTTATPAPAAQ